VLRRSAEGCSNAATSSPAWWGIAPARTNHCSATATASRAASSKEGAGPPLGAAPARSIAVDTQPQERRSTSSPVTVWSSEALTACSDNTTSKAARASSPKGCRTVDRGGEADHATSTSSKPMRERLSGTRAPARSNARRAPRAMESLPAITASKSVPRVRT